MEIMAQGKVLQVIRLMVFSATQWFFTWILKRTGRATDSIMDKKFCEHEVIFFTTAKSIPSP